MPARPLAVATLFTLFAAGAHAAAMSVPLNHSVRLPLAGPAQSVVVGSPSVVDVAVIDSRTVYVSGKAPGATDVTVIDPLGRVVFRGDVSVAGGASVSVFRGAARTEAMCAPYCRDLQADQASATAAASGFAAASPALGIGAGTPTSVISPQAISSMPSTTGLPTEMLHR